MDRQTVRQIRSEREKQGHTQYVNTKTSYAIMRNSRFHAAERKCA